MDANLRYYYNIPEPEKLSDQEWYRRVRELEYLRKREACKR